MSSIKRGKAIQYVISILLILIIFFGIRNAGTFLVVNDGPEEVDAILVLMGSPGDRMLQAVDLYEAGYSDRVLMVDTYLTGREALAERGVHLKTNTELAEELGVALGIPQDAIIIIPGRARSTRDEAIALLGFIERGNKLSDVMIVTSAYHTRRSRAVFRRAFRSVGHDVGILVIPAGQSEFDARRWYNERESAKRVVMEYTRLAWFWIWERWRI